MYVLRENKLSVNNKMKYQVKNKIKLSDRELEAIAHLRTYR